MKPTIPFDVVQEAREAESRIREHIRETPLEPSPFLSQLENGFVQLKLENIQISGSFKLRGAVNKLLSLSDAAKNKGVITASSGNHGMAVAYACQKFNIPGRIFLPEIASPPKVKALQDFGAEIELYGDDCVKAEILARETAKKEDKVYIPPYNDTKTIGGQATVAVELLKQSTEIDSVLVPVGGGGLIAGIAGYLKNIAPGVEVIGCQPINSCVMLESLRAGRIIAMESKPTLSEGSAGGIEKDSVTFDFCRDYVDDFILVSEDEIKEAIRLVFEKHSMIIEGAAALSVASFIKQRERFTNKSAVLILSGARLGAEALQDIFCRGGHNHD
ncbi:MAG: threonine/serine dehydratase [Candidatus Aminicenantes bacterium]|jgi:threonine dehydratase